MDAVIVAARLVQFTGAAILFGTPLFFLYGMRGAADGGRWLRRLLSISSGVVLIGAAVLLSAQTAQMAGDPAAAFDGAILLSVLTGSPFGAAILVRLAAAVAALAGCLAMRDGSRLWIATSVLGAVVLASFAWTGHGAAEEGLAGQVHAAADVVHLLAAGVWLGALIALAGLLGAARVDASDDIHALQRALAEFSGIGSAAVAAILASGLINSWFLVGPSRIWSMGASPYGLLLIAKVGLFVAMLALAAANRFRLTPDLERGLAAGDPRGAVAALRRSIFTETGAGLAVLILVSVLGTLEPVSAQ